MDDNQDKLKEWGYQGQNKPLLPFKGTVPCVQCGLCCRTRACSFGEYNHKEKACTKLKANNDGTYDCTIYNEIISRPGSEWVAEPAFGAGCCSSLFNDDRSKIISHMRAKHRGS